MQWEIFDNEFWNCLNIEAFSRGGGGEGEGNANIEY